VQEEDGTPIDTAVTIIRVPNGGLVDNGAGDVSLVFGGAPTNADYLVGTANAGLSAEIVVGTTPGGELGGTWAAPTVDATHSGSSHLDVERSFVIGRAGTIPVGPASEIADFPFPMPFNATLLRMKATVKTAVSVTKTIRLRKRASGGAFADVSGFTVDLAAATDGGLSGSSNPADVNVDEGDMFQLELEDSAAASGSNLAVEVVYRAR
jgi:hypothetical protein